jgi:translation initiation factor 2 subunit 1
MSATDQIQSPTEEDDTLIPTVRQVMECGPYMTLDDCNNMSRLVHRLEMATVCIRNFELYVRPKQKVVLKVIRINKARPEGEKRRFNGGKERSAYNFVTRESKKLHQLE